MYRPAKFNLLNNLGTLNHTHLLQKLVGPDSKFLKIIGQGAREGLSSELVKIHAFEPQFCLHHLFTACVVLALLWCFYYCLILQFKKKVKRNDNNNNICQFPFKPLYFESVKPHGQSLVACARFRKQNIREQFQTLSWGCKQCWTFRDDPWNLLFKVLQSLKWFELFVALLNPLWHNEWRPYACPFWIPVYTMVMAVVNHCANRHMILW